MSSLLGHFVCSICAKQFTRLASLEQHLGLHDPGLAQASCPECGAKFAWASTLRKHRQKMHGLSTTQHQCSNCSRLFKTKNHLKTHQARDHLKLRKHSCQVCDKAFFGKGELKDHVRIHTGDKPYKCRICQKGFAQRGHRIRHEKETHDGNFSF